MIVVMTDRTGKRKAPKTPSQIAAAEAIDELRDSGALDNLFAKIDAGQIQLTGAGGFVPGLIKAALERGLQTELTEYLGYDKGDPEARFYSNSRNGTSAKTVSAEVGDLDLDIPRDREGTFTPMLVPKGQRRIGGLDDMIISLYAGGMTVRDIQHHLASTIGTELSAETISKITDAVLDEVIQWQNRPLDELYPVMYLDALIVKVRDGGHVRNKAAHIAIGVDMDGIKHVLGIWLQQTEGAKFWGAVCAELANRGVKDVLIVCCDGLSGFPEAIEATWPNAMVQTCVVHLMRAALRFINYTDRPAIVAALKLVYQAPTADAALDEFVKFAASPLGQRCPTAVKTFEDAWERFIPFLAFPPELRRVIYTTNSIESLNYQLRKVTKNRGHFPNDDAVVKMLWLAICNIEDKRTRERVKHSNHHKGAGKRKVSDRLVEGQHTANWKRALAQLVMAFPDRIPTHP
jgi:putative transposase